jgi:hypothetical protein
MKRILFGAIFLSLLSNCKAQINTDVGIVFDTTSYHFGSVNKGSTAEHVFSFVNRSKTSVVISGVKTYCSCVSASWTKEPVMPNATGEIRVKFHGETAGTFHKTVKVFTNMSDKSIDLTVKGQCR